MAIHRTNITNNYWSRIVDTDVPLINGSNLNFRVLASNEGNLICITGAKRGGVGDLNATSFVSPRVSQDADIDEVIAAINAAR